MAVNRELVIITCSEYWEERGRHHFRSGIEAQIDALAQHFTSAVIYAPRSATRFSGYVYTHVRVVELVARLHHANWELPLKLPSYVCRLKSAIRSHPDAIFCVFVPDCFVGVIGALLLRKQRRRNYFLRVTADPGEEFVRRYPSRLRKWLGKAIKPTLDAIMRTAVRDALVFYSGDITHGSGRQDVAVVSTSFDEDFLQPRDDTCLGDTLRLLYVGRFDGKKGVDFLLRALQEIRSRGDNVELTLVGFGEQEELCKRRITELALTDAVRFLGYVPFGPQLQQEYRRADIFVMPSLEEKQGKTPLEAMACGTPVIATNVGGIPTIVRDEHTGLLISPADSGAIVHAIDRLRRDPGLRRLLIANGLSLARTATVSRQAQVMLPLITEWTGADDGHA